MSINRKPDSMTPFVKNPPTNLRQVCPVCGDPLAANASLIHLQPTGRAQLCCTDLHCQQVMRQSQTMNAPAFDAYLRLQSKAIQQRRLLVQTRRARQHAQAVDNSQAFEALQAALVPQATLDPARVISVVLPSGPSLSGVVPRERRRRYLRHLIDIIGQAFHQRPQASTASSEVADAAQAEPEEPGYGSISGQLCAVCRGGCCTRGQDHGYLQPESIQSLLRRDGNLSMRQILRTYWRHVPRLSMLGACINQTQQGCSLPRDLRSNGCNSYLCSAMTAAVRREDHAPALQIAVVLQRQLDHWQHEESTLHDPIVAAALIRTEGFVRLPPPT